MERLSERGHDIRVIDFEISWRMKKTPGLAQERKVFEGYHKATQDGGVTVIRPAFIRLPILDYASLVLTHHREIRRQIGEFKPDVVVGFGILNAAIAIRLARKHELPFVYYIIDELHRLVPQRVFRGLARLIESYALRKSGIVISINEALKDYSILMGTSPDRAQVVRAGIDLLRYGPDAKGREIREKYRIGNEEVVLFFMGWLYEFSGLREVASILLARKDDYAMFRIMIVGRGELWNELTRMAHDQTGLERIILIDWQPYEDMPKYLASSDICLLPARKTEIMMNIVPIKMYEYMASGKPVIATALPGLKKEFGADNGVNYVDEPREVMEKAAELVRNGLIESEGRRSRAFVQGMDWKTTTDSFEGILRAITGIAAAQRKD